MKILVARIPEGGLDVVVAITDAWALRSASLAAAGEARRLDGAIRVKRPVVELVQVEVQVKVSAVAPCDRCLAAADLDCSVRQGLSYMAESDTGNPDGELRMDQLDVGWYSNGEIDLSAVLSEAITLSLPSRWLCTDTAACDERVGLMRQSGEEDTLGMSAFSDLNRLLN